MQDRVTVQVTAAGSPLLEWHCPRCCRRQPYTSTNTFRANANGKRIDVWLIYRCVRCNSSKNFTIAERVPVSRIDPVLLTAAEGNDELLVMRRGFKLTPSSPRLEHGRRVQSS